MSKLNKIVKDLFKEETVPSEIPDTDQGLRLMKKGTVRGGAHFVHMANIHLISCVIAEKNHRAMIRNVNIQQFS